MKIIVLDVKSFKAFINDAISIEVKDAERGSYTLLDNHLAFVTSILEGELLIKTQEKNYQYSLKDGWLFCSQTNSVKIIASYVIAKDL